MRVGRGLDLPRFLLLPQRIYKTCLAVALLSRGWGGGFFRLCPKSSEGVLLFFMLDQNESVFSPLGDPG